MKVGLGKHVFSFMFARVDGTPEQSTVSIEIVRIFWKTVIPGR